MDEELLLIPATLTSDPRDQKRYYFENTPLRRVLTPLVSGVLWPFMDMQVRGFENLPDKGPVVLAANHLSEFDMFPMQFAMQRLIFFMGKAELFRNPVLAAAYRQLGGFPVERGARDPWAYQHALRVLEHGQVLGLFPEGTRSRKHGLLPAKTGAARLAIEARCPVVLVAVEGTQRMFKRSLRRTPVNITMSEPYYPVQGVSALEFMDHLMFTLADMLPAELRGVYAERPKGFRV